MNATVLSGKRNILPLLVVAFLLVVGRADLASAGPGHRLEILYMNHGPMRPTIAKIRDLLAPHTGSIQAVWYDFDTPAGKRFMKDKKLKGHIPLLLVLDGRSDFLVNGRPVRLQGFPSGAGPFKSVEGDWSLEDLQTILAEQVRQKNEHGGR